MFGIIYLTENIFNKKIYIGSDTKNKGFGDPNYLGSGVLLLKAVEKYGKENFRKKTLHICNSLEELREKETYYIRKFSSNNRKIGYNISDGYWGGNTLSEHPNIEKIKEKLSKASRNASETTSLKRKEYFLKETPEKKKIRLENLKNGMAKADLSYMKNPAYKQKLSVSIRESEKFKEYQESKKGVKRGSYNINKERKIQNRVNLIGKIQNSKFKEELFKKLYVDHSTFSCYLKVYLHIEKKLEIQGLDEFIFFLEGWIYTNQLTLAQTKEEYIRLGLDKKNLGKSTTVIKSLYTFRESGKCPKKIIESKSKQAARQGSL